MSPKTQSKPTAKAPAKKKLATKKKSEPHAKLEPEKKARAAWQGSISFGLIHIPVMLFGVATNRRIAFHQLHADDGARIKQKRFCSAEDKEVPYDEIVRGYEITPGRHVVIEPDELKELSPSRSKAIELEKFIDAAEIDPLYYDASYFVVPAEGAGAPYALLREAMIKENRAAVARLVIHSKEHLVALWPREDMLIVSTLHFADEISNPDKFEGGDSVPAKSRKASEVTAARQLVAALTDEFDIADYRDEYREQVLKLIDAKASGKKFAVEPDLEDRKPVKDLMAALEESLSNLSGESKKPRKRGSSGEHKTAASASKKHGSRSAR
jgi:DNA end-binding protein Ku